MADIHGEQRRGSATEHPLWHDLATFTVGDEQVAFGFTRRLARDNGWSLPYATRVMEEYRRFLFLGQVAGHPVTPSDEVDQAWHLHLTYTRSYWDDLCTDVLGRPFHHGPTVGGATEAAKFDDWYARTRASYEAWFGHAPPLDIWPDADTRFGDAPHFVRVNTRRQWVVTKPRPRAVAGRTGLALGGSLALAGCSGLGMVSLLGSGGVSRTLVLVLIIVALVVMAAFALRSGGSGRRTRSNDDASAYGAAGGGWWFFGGGGNDAEDDDRSDGGGGDGGGGGWWSFGGGDGGDGGGGGGCGGGGCGGCGG
ncbi:MAG: hypothetical protein AAF962_21425 [Actinomycetota bacterium]